MSKSIHFFDLDSSHPEKSWSPNTLKTRMVLNYRRIPFTQSYEKTSDVETVCRSVGQNRGPFTFPLLAIPESISRDKYIRDSLPIALWLERTYRPNAYHHPSIFPTTASYALATTVQQLVFAALNVAFPVIIPLLPGIIDDPVERAWFARTREEKFGSKLSEMKGDWKQIEKAMSPLARALSGPGKRGPYFEGEVVGYADFILVAFLYWFKRTSSENWERVRAFGGKEDVFGKLCEACAEWVDGQGEDQQWQAKARL